MDFFEEYLKEIYKNIPNYYTDNWDTLRFGIQPQEQNSFINKLKNYAGLRLNKRFYFNFIDVVNYSKNLHFFQYLFEHLASDDDRKLLIKIIAYRTLNYKKVKLPLNTPDYWKQLKALDKLCDKSDSIDIDSLKIPLNKINLGKIGYPIELYFNTLGVMADFILKQYEYNRNDVVIKAIRNDVVIDCGGCWGDTALYFANEVGDGGKVFSFEFIPNNIKIFEKNLSLNKTLEKNIQIVKHPVWKESLKKVYFIDKGPGSNVSFDKMPGATGEAITCSIDDLVSENKIQKLDYIKMDIEGAESSALLGAIKTIKQFKPKLAISLYHSLEDFDRVPKFIKELVPEYQFYFSHCTIHSEESVLFAKVS